MALLVLVKLLLIQFNEGKDLRDESKREAIREINIEADRGNIYSSNGKLLATSMPVYDVYFDPLTVHEDTFQRNIGGLSAAMGQAFPERTSRQWENYFQGKKSSRSRYVRLASDVSFAQLQNMRQFPILKLGRYKGGLIYEQKNFRKMPLGKIAERTIGYDKLHASTGIEGAYSNYLSGKDGKRLKQKVSNGNWKPVTDHYEVEPQNGYDIITTLDTRMQDVVHHELLKVLEKYEADHGCAVVMEVETGAIKAISNLGRTEKGTYFEKRNYAVWESTEPGSTFKLASVLVALEDGVIDTNTRVDTENGLYTIYGKHVRDSNYKNGKGGYGVVSLKKAFELSSNVGIVKLIYSNYQHDPQRFVDRLYKLDIHQSLGLPIKGEGKPKIPKPQDPQWSGISLPWMSFGYQVSFTPLQVLTFYNAVANEGKMVKPRFIEEVSRHGRTIEKIETEVINPSICSKETLYKLQSMLRGVVENGTATNIDNPLFELAGKTGTCQQNYWKESTTEYQASFAGYFPAENPKYSCIVVVNKPNYHRGYYGSAVAAPVFSAIAKSIYLSTPIDEVDRTGEGIIAGTEETEEDIEQSLSHGSEFPDLRGLNGYKVLSKLENNGYKVKVSGNGKVIWQYPSPGKKLNGNELIELKLG